MSNKLNELDKILDEIAIKMEKLKEENRKLQQENADLKYKIQVLERSI